MQGRDFETRKLVPGGVAKETKKALSLLGELLTAARSSMDKVIACSVSLVNVKRDFADMNTAYSAFWAGGAAPPSRITVEVAALAGNANVEIMCIAAGAETDRAPVGPTPAGFPLSPAIKSGGIVYVSGMQGREGSQLVPGGVANETTKALSNIASTLKEADSNLSLAIGCEVYLDSMSDFPEMNKAYEKFWPAQGGFPSRVCVQAGIGGGAAVEIRCLAATSSGPKPRIISSVPGWTPLKGFPLSLATVAGSTVYLSGMQGVDPTTMKLVPGGIAEETKQTLKNVGDMLKAAGSSMVAIIECEVSLVTMNEFAAMNAAYAAFWPYGEPPSRIAVQVGSLAGEARVEIKCAALTDMHKTSLVV